MNAEVRPLFTARKPLQDRSISRFEHVIDAADALLAADGLQEFSIPKLAEKLGYTRASIYKFFPTPYAVLNEIARRYLHRLEREMNAATPQVAGRDWTEGVTAMVGIAADFYDRHPTARILLLGGPLTDDSYQRQELTIQRLGKLAQGLLARQGIELPEESLDAAALAVDFGTACFRMSHFLHGKITPAYRKEAARAMVAYLKDRIDTGADRSTRR